MTKYIETFRPNGEIVGYEVSRQRRYVIRNPEKRAKLLKKYKRSGAMRRYWHTAYVNYYRKNRKYILEKKRIQRLERKRPGE